jgi:hypothetical protein
MSKLTPDEIQQRRANQEKIRLIQEQQNNLGLQSNPPNQSGQAVSPPNSFATSSKQPSEQPSHTTHVETSRQTGVTGPPDRTVLPHVPSPIVDPGVLSARDQKSIPATTGATVPPDSDTEVVGELILTDAEHPAPARLGAQVKLDIGRISGQVADSGLRSLIAGYQRPVSPTFASDSDAHFPRSIRRHTVNKHRSQVGGYGNVLLFHIGDAVLAYYNIENGVATQTDLNAIEKLHQIAMGGAGTFVVGGAENLGFYLTPRSGA